MAKTYTFRNITGANLAWHPELAEGSKANEENYLEYIVFEGQLEGDYVFNILFLARPMSSLSSYIEDNPNKWPCIHLFIMTPDGKSYRNFGVYPPESFKPEPWGAVFGDNIFKGKLKPNGLPAGYDLKVSIDDMGLDISASAVSGGVKFVDEEPGWSHYNPEKKTALGWWPLVVKADSEGTLTIKGKPIKVRGAVFCEHYLGNLPAMFGSSGQAMWCWGHFNAGDYSAVWTDSAASSHFRHRHFTPFVLWKGGTVVLSTFNFASSVEKFQIDPDTGRLRPEVVSLRASDGSRELTAQLLPGKVIETVEFEGPPSIPERRGSYFRQYSNVDVQIKHWGDTEEVSGTAIYALGAGSEWFPFEALRK